MIERLKRQFFKTKPEIAAINDSLNQLENSKLENSKSKPETSKLQDFFKNILPESKSPERANRALYAIRSALNLPSQKVRSAWNIFTGFFRTHKRKIGLSLAGIGASIGVANVNPVLAQQTPNINAGQIVEQTKVLVTQNAGEGGFNQLTPGYENYSEALRALEARNRVNLGQMYEHAQGNAEVVKLIENIRKRQNEAFEKTYNGYSNYEIKYNQEDFDTIRTNTALLSALITDLERIVDDYSKKAKSDENKISATELQNTLNLSVKLFELKKFHWESKELLDQMAKNQGLYPGKDLENFIAKQNRLIGIILALIAGGVGYTGYVITKNLRSKNQIKPQINSDSPNQTNETLEELGQEKNPRTRESEELSSDILDSDEENKDWEKETLKLLDQLNNEAEQYFNNYQSLNADLFSEININTENTTIDIKAETVPNSKEASPQKMDSNLPDEPITDQDVWYSEDPVVVVPDNTYQSVEEIIEDGMLYDKTAELLGNLNRLGTDLESAQPEFITMDQPSTNNKKEPPDDDDQTPPPGGDASATTNSESAQPKNIPKPESEDPENTFRQLEEMLDEMEVSVAQQRINQNQTIQNTNPYYQVVKDLSEEEAFEYLESLVEDEQVVEELELNKRISLLSDQIEQLLRLQLRQEDKSGVEDLKTMFLKELKEGGFSKQEVLDFFEPIIDRIWQKISEYQITTPQFDSTTKTLSAVETDPELVNLRQELKELVETAKSSGLLVQSYERITGLGLTPELLKVQIENLKLEIVTKTLKDIQQNKPIAISLETQKLITDSELVKAAIERSPEFLVPEFFQNFIVVSQERIKNPQAPEFEKQAIIALLNTIYTTFAFKSIFVDQPLFTQTVFQTSDDILEAVQNPDQKVIYTDGKNSFVVSMLKIRNRISLKMRPKDSKGFGYLEFFPSQIGKDFPVENFSIA